MTEYDNIWILEGLLRTFHGATLRDALAAAFPLADDPEEEGTVVDKGSSAFLHWRSTASMTFDTLVGAIQSAAPDAVGTLTVQYPYSDDPSPVFLVFSADGVLAHLATWVPEPEPVRRWLAPTALDCPVCGTSQGLEQRVNAESDAIWVCTTCPAVLFAFHDASSLRRLAQVLRVSDPH